MDALEERIAKVLSTQFKVEFAAIDSSVTFNELRLDSLILVELALVLENEFQIMIEDGELTDDMTIGDAAALLANKGATL